MSLSVYDASRSRWPCSGSRTSTFGTSPSRRKLRSDPSASHERHDEVVDATQLAFDFLAGWLRDDDGHDRAA